MDAVSAAARPWIEAAKPIYPCLIDNDHRVADLYHMVNVPQAVWIEETGHIVRPTESAGAYEGFRAMDRTTRKVPDEVAAITSLAKRTYVEAVRDWVVRGSASINAFEPEAAVAHLSLPDETVARAHAHFRLGQHLLRHGQAGHRAEHRLVRPRPDRTDLPRPGGTNERIPHRNPAGIRTRRRNQPERVVSR